MNRVSLQPEHEIIGIVGRLLKGIEHITNKQLVGYDVLKPTVNTTNSDYDLQSTDTFGFHGVRSEITFTAENQPDVFATLALKFYDLSGNEIDPSSFTLIFLTPYVQEAGNHMMTWSLDAERDLAFRIKLYVLATDRGTITTGP